MTETVNAMTLSDADFRKISAIAAHEAGLAIPEAKKSLVQSRVARRMRALGIDSSGAYLDSLEGDADETENLISALTTNVSHFFREKHHFEFLSEKILNRSQKGRFRIWSAGCSNGQEPYSLAIQLLKEIPDATKRDILILASDIDKTVLAKAKSGVYDENEIDGVPLDERSKYFAKTPDGSYEASDDLRTLVRFRQLNLNSDHWPMRGPFDVIFCRNVVIYFDDVTQTRLWSKFHALLQQGGHLMLGHSERVHPLADSGFEAVGVTTYRKL